jgi:hypothetical protein
MACAACWSTALITGAVHSTALSGDRWGDDVRLSDLEPLFTCKACGIKGADGVIQSG